MAIFKKVKDWLGIEGVKIQLTLPETFQLKEGVISGSYEISSQSEQHIEKVHVVLKEKYQRGRRKSKLIDEYTLAEKTFIIDQGISPEEVMKYDFDLSYELLKSGMDRFGDKNILNRGLVSIARLIKNAKSSYSITAEVTVRGNRLKPYNTVQIVAE